MGCNCEGCKKLKAMAELKKLLPEDRQEEFEAFIEDYINVTDERDHYDAIITGAWPNADKIIEYRRKKWAEMRSKVQQEDINEKNT